MNNRQNAFWRAWNSHYKNKDSSRVSPIIDNNSNPQKIAESFRDYLSTTYIDSSDDRKATDQFNDLKNKLELPDPTFKIIDMEEIGNAINQLNLNKSSDHENLFSEHIYYSHPAIALHLKQLFTLIICHSYVPKSFTLGLVSPIVKNKQDDITALSNYRPITISSTISKVFEYFLLNRVSCFLIHDELQFAYSKNIGCPNAIFLLRRVILHFNNNASNIYLSSLDASKAFDRINHFKLFSTLIKKGFPNLFIKTIINWYSRLSVRVKWLNSISTSLTILSGVRQGSVLSGPLFNIYVDDFITKLRQKDLGCHIKNVFLGSLMYADDLILLSASVKELQLMLDICSQIGDELSVKFNPSKSKCMVIGPHLNLKPYPLTLGNLALPWVSSLEYLGISIMSHKSFKIDLSNVRRKFFASVNSILSKCNFTSDIVKLSLLESYSLPILLYAVECLNLPPSDLADLNAWWNSAYRKIFNYKKWESVRALIGHLGRMDFLHINNLKSVKFIHRLLNYNDNTKDINYYMINIYAPSSECFSILNKYGCSSDVKPCNIYTKIFNDFRLNCFT